MRKLLIVFALLTISLYSCEEEEPQTGNALLLMERDDLQGVSWDLYTEAYLNADRFVPPLDQGILGTADLRLEGLNPGNYVLVIRTGFQWHIAVQITAGQTREFRIQ